MREVVKQEDIDRMLELREVPEKEIGRPDSYTLRLLKYIPSEVIALYVGFNAALRIFEGHPMIFWAQLYCLVFGAIATPLYLWRIHKVRKRSQLAISTIAFILWVFALGGPFKYLPGYSPLWPALLLPSYTFLIALYKG